MYYTTQPTQRNQLYNNQRNQSNNVMSRRKRNQPIYHFNKITILIRNTYRPNTFSKCIQSVLMQEYTNYSIIMCYDDDRCMEYLEEYRNHHKIALFNVKRESEASHFYNLYCNHLLDRVRDGWILFLDDDNMLSQPDTLKKINNNIKTENDIIFWKVKLGEHIIFPNIYDIKYGQIDAAGFCFHSKYKNAARWIAEQGSDFHYVTHLLKKHYLIRRAHSEILTQSVLLKQFGQNGRKEEYEFKEFKTLIIRILGNDLEGLHGDNQTYDNLKFILEHEPKFMGVDKVFVLNRILNNDKKHKLIELLDQHGTKYIEIPFSYEEFRKLGNLQISREEIEKLNYKSSIKEKHKTVQKIYPFNQCLVNNNSSRNFCINYGKENGYEWTVVLDSNSFLTEKYFNQIVSEIPKDTEYIVIPQIRVSDGGLENKEIIYNEYKLEFLPIQEPQIAFHINSKHKFNYKICYGCGPKAELLTALDVNGIWNKWSKNNAKYLNMSLSEYQRKLTNINKVVKGKVIRLCSYNKNNNIYENWTNRLIGIYNLYHKVNEMVYNKTYQELKKIKLGYTIKNQFIIFVPYCDIYEPFIIECLESIDNQNYSNFETIIINDGGNKTEKIQKFIDKKFNYKLINFPINHGPAYSKWKFIEYCRQNSDKYSANDICLIVDGDDYLLGNDVLNIINEKYLTEKCRMTYGSYEGKWSQQTKDIDIKDRNFNYRDTKNWRFGHPRSYKFGFNKLFKEDDFKLEGEWLQKATDATMIYNLLEWSGSNKIAYISDKLYYYREHGNNSYKKVDHKIKKQILSHLENKIPQNKIVDNIHVVLCVYNRLSFLPQQLKYIQEQTVSERIVLHILNNNLKEKPTIEKMIYYFLKNNKISVRVTHYDNKYNVFQRFFYIRDYLLQSILIDYVIIIDDDKVIPKNWVENMWNLRTPQHWHSWFGKIWAKDNIDYWNGSLITAKDCGYINGIQMKKYIDKFFYMGPGGCIIDVSIFNQISYLWNTPNDLPDNLNIYMLDDIWLSYIIFKYYKNWVLKRSYYPLIDIWFSSNKNHKDIRSKSLTLKLKEKKQILLNYIYDKNVTKMLSL